MGGKQKQAQRTKNNARPSSSGRSAELLGNSIPQFTGFSTITDASFSLPNLAMTSTDELSDSLLDSNFQLVMKKMNKKDTTTKLKALQEFTDLIKGTDQDTVKNILIHWSRLYNILSTDADHKVREATHCAHHQVVLKAKRNLAPYLKQLAGPWFTSQYDTYAPAASAATKSFEDAFPPNKLQEAIVYCQDEILYYVYDNLIVQTMQTLNSNLKASTEDAEAKYERIVISSLQGYALYINKLDSENIEKAAELNKKIISSSKFWKFSKSKVVPIRTAFFGLLKMLCQKASFLLDSEVEHVITTIFTNLDETEPTVLPNMWEAALLSVTTFEEWYKHINVEKVIYPKLYKVLREGVQGNASVIYPNLLPFVSNLPPTNDNYTFYILFFESMRIGLKQRSAISSRSEFAAVCVTLVECLQYIIMINQANLQLCEKLIKTQLIPTIQWCLTDGPASYKTLFKQVAGLVQYWHRNRLNSDVSNYQKYLELFWNQVDSLFQGLLMNVERSYEKNAVSDLATRQIELLTSFKHTIKPRKQMKVTFEKESSFVEVADLSIDTEIKSDKCDELYESSLNLLIFKLCQSYVNFINQKQSREMLDHLSVLIVTFENKEFFERLVEVVSGTKKHGQLINIYDLLLIKWLKSDYLQTSTVTNLIFLLFKYLEDGDKLRILDTFAKLDNKQYGWCIANALSFPSYCDPVIQYWLCNEKVAEYLVSIAKMELIEGNSTPDSSILLKKAFTEQEDGELFISESAVEEIIELISTCLLNPADHIMTLDTCARFAAYISSTLYTETLKLRYGTDLLLTLFTLSCNTRLDLDTITEDTLWEVSTACQDVIGTLCSCLEVDELKFVVNKLATIIENEFLNNDIETFNSEEIVDKIVSIIRVVKKNKGFVVFKSLELFLERDFFPKWRSDLTQLSTCAEYVQGNLSSLYSPIEGSNINVENEEILKYFTWLSLSIDVLLTPIDAAEEYDEEEEKEENREDSPKTIHTMIDASDNIYNVMLNVLYDVTLAGIIKENFKTIKSYSRLVEISSTFVEKLKILMGHIDSKSDIERTLMERVASNGWLWAKVIYFLNGEITKENLADVYNDYLNTESFQEYICQSRVHLTQAFAKSISFEDVFHDAYLPEKIVNLRSLMYRDDVYDNIGDIFKLIDSYKIKCGNIYNLDLSNWRGVETVIEIMRLGTAVIKNNKVECLDREHWDFAVISLASWCTKLPVLRTNYKKLQIASFISVIAELFVYIETYLRDLEQELPESDYIDEWRAVFARDVHSEMVNTWLYLSEKLLEQYKIELPKMAYLPFIQHFGSSVSLYQTDYIFKVSEDKSIKWSRLLKVCCGLFIHPLHSLQIWGYHMLLVLVPELVDIDYLAVNCGEPNIKELIFEQFKDLLVQTEDIVHTMLIDFKLGENSCRVEPYTDSYTYTFSYLLLWDLLLTMCQKSPTELKYQYVGWLRHEDFLNNLLNNIFKLVPAEVLHCSDTRIKPFEEWFLKKFELSLTDPIRSNKIERIACWVYSTMLTEINAPVRNWWSSIETRVNQIVDRVTSTYVSPHLCNLELTDVAQHENKFKNMVVKIHPSVREIVAIYTVDEAEMDLVITLPTNYPLVGPNVQCNKQIGGVTHKQWLMQLKMCVLHQNGRIWDGLSIWNNNLDKKFDGVEECYICFAVLHPGTYQLPKLSCQTCKKKFHSACLYKWFSTSNKSTCPICRNLF